MDRSYALRGYLTARNVAYRSPAKRVGGTGRGEVDLLAVRLGGGGIEDCARVETSFSVTSKFPFLSPRPGVDEVGRLVKRFFSFLPEQICHN